MDEKNRYLEEYYKNEYDANKQMAIANVLGGVFILIVWVLYLTNVFTIHGGLRIVIDIMLPIDALILFSPIFYIKSKHIKKPGFKYFVIFSFVLVIGVLNMFIPKHATLGWAICIILTNHYYNPKLGRTVFITVLASVLVCMYIAMFIGEYDPYLLGNGIIKDGEILWPNVPSERLEMLNNMIRNGENRFIKVFFLYYLPRSAALTIIFFVCNSLNKRTYNLLVSEIRVNSSQEKINTELNVAKDIQLATLPREFVTNQDVEVLAEIKAAKEVGGDFYDYVNIDDTHIAIVIGDVSGKGIPAAMFMMKTITCFKNFIRKDKTPAEILREVNASIFDGNDAKMFVTCFLGILDTKTGTFEYANAGHCAPVIGSNRHYRYLHCKTGFILGVTKDVYVFDEKTELKKNETVMLYTDGITEARNKKGEFYGDIRFLNFLNSRDFTCTLQVHHDLKDSIAHFTQGAEQSDDITFLSLKYQGDKCEIAEELFDINTNPVSEMLDYIENFCQKNGLNKEFTNRLLVVGDEMLSNIKTHGYKNQEGTIFIRLVKNFTTNEFSITIIDKAPAFNQLEVNNSSIADQNAQAGGLGILIVKNLMDEYAYDYINEKNILILRKKF